ncbi:sulfatase family protein [Algoriphagus mannitolivorans]|uniref:sulfatase family protein n=1 Tax=Algoriphagus mannitolivorans TaxID=226504 RepID=UPI00041AD552|nr:sulfatase [Algoriphagus mannitolivorans]
MKTTKNQSIGISIILISTLFFGLPTSKAQAPSHDKMNFIIIFADDLGYGDLSSFGNPSILTPNLDRMAMEGQKWTNFYVGASVCTPSRAALMTGRLPIRNGMMSSPNRVLYPNSANGLPESEITLAEQLKKAGYKTGMVGKWHLGHKEPYLPTNHGFDSYYGIPYSNDMDITRKLTPGNGYWELWTKLYDQLSIEDFNVPLLRGTEIIERPANQHTISERYTDESIAFIRKNKDHPFFLYLAHNFPHVPLFTNERFKGSSKGGLYGDVVEEMDYQVGRILEALKEEGLDKNTLVVFTSDNGPWLPTEISGGTAGQLRDGKGTTWEGGMREPTIFWAPGNIKPGVITDLGTTMDLFTTFSRIAGQELPKDRELDGYDLSGVLFNKESSPRKEVYYYRERELYAVRLGSFKAHFITKGGYGKVEKLYHEVPLLYNVDQDPSERFNIAEAHPEIIEKIKALVKEHESKMVKMPDMLKDLESGRNVP